jgi:hypothetical protein
MIVIRSHKRRRHINKPDRQDYEEVNRRWPHHSDAEKYRLAQATKFIRLFASKKEGRQVN